SSAGRKWGVASVMRLFFQPPRRGARRGTVLREGLRGVRVCLLAEGTGDGLGRVRALDGDRPDEAVSPVEDRPHVRLLLRGADVHDPGGLHAYPLDQVLL